MGNLKLRAVFAGHNSVSGKKIILSPGYFSPSKDIETKENLAKGIFYQVKNNKISATETSDQGT